MGIAIDQVGVLVYPSKNAQRRGFFRRTPGVISVDSQGVLTDCLVIGYTNEGFVDAAMAAMKRWSYQPAMVMGRARASRARKSFFTVPGPRSDGPEPARRPRAPPVFRLSWKDRYVYRPCKLSELDGTPVAGAFSPARGQ